MRMPVISFTTVWIVWAGDSRYWNINGKNREGFSEVWEGWNSSPMALNRDSRVGT
jgi:hypothetical protein